MKMEELNSELVKFIEEEILDTRKVITPDLLIEDDLGISGDDAYDFIISYSKRFSIDISGFSFSKYFHSEVTFFITDKSPLTIGMLNQAIKDKKLI